ncbi:hypothetical protein SADUNF_Sadunf19G0055800 [Salix dunnii]|uniref:GAG-pre-integrase domain-containing protein n=1 Tax=Salix dunnii TaxID=1413687 RepID=A0A835J1H8_9ROSI|nr:hypothetical protein SADUNF_Sadunf19G0055800 [Salix dunnii]
MGVGGYGQMADAMENLEALDGFVNRILVVNGEEILKERMKGISFSFDPIKDELIAFSTIASNTKMWHKRLCHYHLQTMQTVKDKELTWKRVFGHDIHSFGFENLVHGSCGHGMGLFGRGMSLIRLHRRRIGIGRHYI